MLDPREAAMVNWIVYDNYNVNVAVQKVCKILSRLRRPVTLHEFLVINPDTYLGFHGVGVASALQLKLLRIQFLTDYPELRDKYNV
jgi:hypothetical protein